MGDTDSPPHAGLSSYGVDEQGGLRAALETLDRRMGIFGRYVDHQGRAAPMRVNVYEGYYVDTGPDSEELMRAKSLVYSTRTDRASSVESQYARIYRALRRAGYPHDSLEWEEFD